MDSTEFRIKTEAFEGPLDLLLHLIEKRKLLINDISLASVTDDFVAHVQEKGTLHIARAAHFVYIAATLLLIKSKSLLPLLQLTAEEEESIEDLERRLKLLKFFKQIADNLKPHFGRAPLFFRAHVKITEPIFAPPASVTLGALHHATQTLIAELPQKEVLKETAVRKVISLEEMIDRLRGRVEQTLRMSFKDFVGSQKEKVHVIVGFLAVLELVKQEVITVTQGEHFSDFTMENQTITTPRYGN